MRKRKGAITVFLIIVLFSVVLFGGLFIDATRVLLAKRVIRNDLNSAARSALSYYDENMAGEYGLFAVEKTEAEDAFRRYFKTNLKLSQNEGFDILSMNVEDKDITVEVSAPLTASGTLQDEMAEYSKYRSVVNTALGVVEKLKGLFGGASEKVFNAADTGKSAQERLAADAKRFSNSARTTLSAIRS